MIDGVEVKQLKVMEDERGWLMEILRSDDKIFERFGQVYITTAYPDVVKAWHYHKNQTDYFTCIKGTARLVLCDGREDSPTHMEVNEFVMGMENPILVKIPSLVYHGFSAIGDETAFIVNVPTRAYNREKPDEYRLPPDTKKLPYRWKLKPGLKHG
ncbi:MAG: dTDP-4-dehydrorhamnose 3,5-epimerase family protein [Candidatus Altiarchaeota archaeon]|nr:dTDP-4-dehydrorhamnose 3,5-epimerase family protein [Candidatus Altiarchaeota archaeon]